MGNRLITAAFKTRVKPPARKLLLVRLADRADDDTGECWPGHESLAKDCGMTTKSVGGHLTPLATERHITIRKNSHRADRGKSRHSYLVHPVTPEDISSATPEDISPVTPEKDGGDTGKFRPPHRKVSPSPYIEPTGTPKGTQRGRKNASPVLKSDSPGGSKPKLFPNECARIIKTIDNKLERLIGKQTDEAKQTREKLVERKRQLESEMIGVDLPVSAGTELDKSLNTNHRNQGTFATTTDYDAAIARKNRERAPAVDDKLAEELLAEGQPPPPGQVEWGTAKPGDLKRAVEEAIEATA